MLFPLVHFGAKYTDYLAFLQVKQAENSLLSVLSAICRGFRHSRQVKGKASVYQVAPSHNQETLRSALGDTLEHQSEGRSLNPHRSPNVSPRAERRVS